MKIRPFIVSATFPALRGNPIKTLKGFFMGLFILATLLDGLSIGTSIIELVAKVAIVGFAWIHGAQHYGIRNMLAWFGITWLVSNSFEGLSIATGFPYGNYHYEIPGPRIAGVPVMIMPSYFGMGYIAWTLALVLTGQFHQKLQGLQKLTVPLVAAFLMTAYDLVTDPIASTVDARWVWHGGGAYFGVPLTNFAGWLLVVYLYHQVFALFISNLQKTSRQNVALLVKKSYWIEPVIVYFCMGLLPVFLYLTHTEHAELFASMALISVFTVILFAFLSYISIRRSNEAILGK